MAHELLRRSRGREAVRHRPVADRDAEVGGAVLAIIDALDASVAVRVEQRIAGDRLVIAAVVDEHVAALLVDGEAVVAGAVDAGHFRADEHRLGRFHPALRVHDVGVVARGQHAERIAIVGGACRIGHEQAAVAREHRWRLGHLEPADLPVERRHGQAHGLARQRQRGLERRQIEVGVGLDPRLALRPAEIGDAAMLEDRRIEVEAVERRLELAEHLPVAGHRIEAVAHDRIGADAEHVLAAAAGAGCEIHDPLALEEVQFGRPEEAGHRAGGFVAPQHALLSGGKARQGARAAQHQPVILRHRAGQVIIAVGVAEHLRIGALLDERVHRHRGGGSGTGCAHAGDCCLGGSDAAGGTGEEEAAVEMKHVGSLDSARGGHWAATGQPSAPQVTGAMRSVGAPFFSRS